jgi:hypothetical protein
MSNGWALRTTGHTGIYRRLPARTPPSLGWFPDQRKNARSAWDPSARPSLSVEPFAQRPFRGGSRAVVHCVPNGAAHERTAPHRSYRERMYRVLRVHSALLWPLRAT